MKKHGLLPLVVAAFLLLAPTVVADDGSALGSLENLIGQLVAIFLGDEPELGLAYPPGGDALTSEDPELGLNYPPSGEALTGDEPELGLAYPPNG